MASTDEASYLNSTIPQSVSAAAPFTEKNYNWLSDINSGVYTNTSLTQVNFDLSSIYNSNLFTNTEDAFLTIPIVTVATYCNGTSAANATARSPPNGGHGLVTMKQGAYHLVHQVELVSGGQVLQESQPFANVIKHVKLLSQLSATDLQQLSSSFGLADRLDNPDSVKWLTVAGQDYTGATAATCTLPGVGLTNNQAYLNGTSASLATGVGPSGYCGTQGVAGPKGAYTTNDALQKRIARIASTAGNTSAGIAVATGTNVSGSNVYGTTVSGQQPVIMSSTELEAEFKSYYSVSGNKMIWKDLAVIPVKWLCDSFRSMGLTRKLDCQLRLWLNTGSFSLPVNISTAGYAQYGAITSNTFTNTVPVSVNTLPVIANWTGTTPTPSDGFFTAAAIGTGTFGYLAVGTFVSKSATTSIGVAGVDLSGVSHAMPSCRFYYSQIMMEPERALSYINSNRQKTCVFESYIFNQYNGITAGGTFSQLIQSGIRNPLALCVIPLISSTQVTLSGGTNQLGFSQYANPCDMCPGSFSPISLSNYQVSLGGSNIFKSGSLYYSFENFLEQFVLADSIVAGIGAANVGVIDEKWWSSNRIYWADLSRSSESDKASMRNLTVSFKNNSLVTIDLLVFTIYSSQVLLDVESGRTVSL